MILTLKITLADSKPVIWRRISIPADYSLHVLHHAIQIAFDWFNGHLHDFSTKNGFRYALPEDYMDLMDDEISPLFPVYMEDPVVETSRNGAPVVDTRSIALGQFLREEGDILFYTYDLGDNWEHKIVVEGVFPIGPEIPVLLAGENCRPPEDCGGMDSFKIGLKLLAKKRKSADDKDELETIFGKDWQDFDPKEFDLADNAKLMQSNFKEALDKAKTEES